MGMVLGITRLRDETISRIVADPPLVWKIIAPDDTEAYERSRQDAERATKPGFIARLFGAKAPTPPPSTAAAPIDLIEDEGAEIDLDKSWHGIHWVLAGSPDGGNAPLDFLVEGGQYVGDEDVGYGPARVFTSAETKTIANALNAVSDDAIRSRFNPRAMSDAGVYPEALWIQGESSDEPLEYLTEYVKVLRETLSQAVAEKQGILISLS